MHTLLQDEGIKELFERHRTDLHQVPLPCRGYFVLYRIALNEA